MATPAATQKSLSERVDSFPESWRHEPGDKLVGIVADRTGNEREYGPYEILTVLVTEASTEALEVNGVWSGGHEIELGAERAWHAFGTVPENEIEKQNPRPGDRIAVKYFGRSSEAEDAYKRYRVLVEHEYEPDEPTNGSPTASQVGGASPTPGASEEAGGDDIPF